MPLQAFAEHIRFCANKLQLGVNFMPNTPNYDRVVEMQALNEALGKAFPDMSSHVSHVHTAATRRHILLLTRKPCTWLWYTHIGACNLSLTRTCMHAMGTFCVHVLACLHGDACMCCCALVTYVCVVAC